MSFDVVKIIFLERVERGHQEIFSVRLMLLRSKMNSGGDGLLLIAILASLVQEFFARSEGVGILYSLFSAESNRLPVL